jgi:PKD repeat protein
MNYSDDWYYYELNSIPLNHYFLGDSNVFAFAFNFTGLTSGQAQINLTILNNIPTISNIADVYVSVGDNYSIFLNNYAIDLEDQILTWNILSNSSLFSTNIDTNNMLTIIGLVEGIESVTLRAYDLDNDFAETTINVHVIPETNNINLTATCNANPTNGTNPLDVEFTTTTIGGIGPYAYIWTYDDGQVGIDSDATNHTYNTGTYSPTVTIIDSINNRLTTRCGRITVTDNNVTPTNMTVSCFAMPDSGTAPLTVLLNTIVSNGIAPYTYTYDYGNGTTSTNQNNLRVITYDTIGVYNPTVEVTDNNGVIGTASCGVIMVGDNNGTNILTANTGGPYISHINEALTFNASLSNGNIVRYSWDFGDGTIVDSITPEVQHTYNQINRYNVVLTVYGIYGNSDSANTVVTVVERTAPKIIDTNVQRDLPDKGIVVKSLTLFGKNGGDTLGSNDYLSAKINVKNEWDSKLTDVRVTLSIPELGLDARSSTFDFSRGSEHSETVVLPLYDVAPGIYYVKVEVHNNQGGDEVRRIKYREIIVK